MILETLTYGQIKEIQKLFKQESSVKETPFEIGKNYLIRTVTMTHSGKVKAIIGDFLVLTSAAWIADTGRFSEALVDQNKFNEVEPFLNEVFVNITTIIDATQIEKLITSMK